MAHLWRGFLALLWWGLCGTAYRAVFYLLPVGLPCDEIRMVLEWLAMGITVTANRKRPQSLDEVIGQDFVVSTLRHSLKANKVAHAYLLSGPRGTGKTSTARVLAKALNCRKGPGGTICGECPSCIEVSSGRSPDVIEIDGASHTSVNDVREIRDEVLYAPQGSGCKVYIVDEVHMLSNSAFNALLKTIEEPPPYIVFIFATTEVHKVPATIRSRCQQFRFRLFSPEQIGKKLLETARELEYTFEPDALNWLAREAGGSMRDAYTLFDQVVSFSGKEITLGVISEKMGLVGIDSITEILDAASRREQKLVQEKLDEILVSGTAVDQVVLELADVLRSYVLLSYGIEKDSLLGWNLERFPRGPLDVWDCRRLELAVDDLFDLYRDIRFSVNPRYELELFLGRLCGLQDRLEASEIVEKIKRLKEDIGVGQRAGPTWRPQVTGVGQEEEGTRHTAEDHPKKKF